MSSEALYRFAVLSYLPDLEGLVWPGASPPDYTLDYFMIPYEEPDLGVTNLLEQGYEVILTYSTFAFTAIRDGGYSVVNIQKTDMDIIQALLQARSHSTNIGLTVHANEIVDIHLLEQLCNITLHKISFSTREELYEGVYGCLRKGVQVFVGGGFTSAMAKHYGATYFHIAPSFHNFDNALRQALIVAKTKRKERLRHEELMAIFKLFQEGVLYIDENRNCVYCNNMARKLLKVGNSADCAAFSPYYDTLKLNDVLDSGEAYTEHIATIGRKQLVINALPVSLPLEKKGAVAFFRDIADLHDFAGRVRASQLHGFIARETIDEIKGQSPGIVHLKNMLEAYAPHDLPVLIHGETGTGKDLAAQAIHNASKRRGFPFVAINCAALPESLLESELFGYDEGAFTGARRGGKAGIFELAHTGTLFLDEVGDLGYNAQLRLLRVLESKEVFRVGGNRAIAVDIRIISASHKSLSSLVQSGQFRADLFYRLAVLRLQIPALRNRQEDLELLLADILARHNRSLDSLTAKMLEAMRSYSWPGNVRELRSVMDSYLILLGAKKQDEKLFMDIFLEWTREQPGLGALGGNELVTEGLSGDLKSMVNQVRKRIVQETVERHGQDKQQAAVELGISYNTLWRILN